MDREPKTLTERLLLIQADLPVVKKDMTNPFHKSKYADINSYLEVLTPLFRKHRVIVLQPLTVLPDGTPALSTIIRSEEGEELSFTVPLVKQADPQKLGAFITYCRRYALQSLFCLQAEDDDGEGYYDRTPARPQHTAATPVKREGKSTYTPYKRS